MRFNNFWALFSVQFFGAMNDNIFKNALIIMLTFNIIQTSNNIMFINICAGLFILPFFLFSAWAGMIGEMYEKSRLIKLLKGFEFLLAIIALIGFSTNNIYIMLAVLFGLGVQATFFGPIKYSILPQHLEETFLVKANAYIEGGTFLAILIGTIIGGYFIQHVSYILIIIALIGLFFSFFIQNAPANNYNLVFNFNPIKATIDIVKKGMEKRIIFLSILGISWFWFLGAIILTELPIFVKDILNGDNKLITILLSIFSIGIGIGSIICDKLSHKQVEIGLVPIGSFFVSIFLLMLYISAIQPNINIYMIGISFFLISIFSAFFTVPLYSLIQQRSDKEYRSRTIAANNIINAFFMVLASIFAIVFLKYFNIIEIFLALFILNIIIGLYVYTQSTEFLWRFVFWFFTNFINKENEEMIIKNHEDFNNVIHISEFSIIKYLIATKYFRHNILYIVYYKSLTPFWYFIFKHMGSIIYTTENELNVLINDYIIEGGVHKYKKMNIITDINI